MSLSLSRENGMDPNVTDLCNETFSASPCRLFSFILCGIMGLTISLIGLCGNCISLLILQRLGKYSVSMFLLRTLSVADSAYLLGYAFNYALPSIMDLPGDPRLTFSGYNYFWLRVAFPWYCTFGTVSSWLTCLLAIHRWVVGRFS